MGEGYDWLVITQPSLGGIEIGGCNLSVETILFLIGVDPFPASNMIGLA